MKLARLLGFTLMLVAALTLVGASAASAASKLSGCLGTLVFKEGHMSCVGTYHLETSLNVKASAAGIKLEGGLAEACNESSTAMTVMTGKEAGVEGTLSVSSLSFTGECKPCSQVEVTGLPYVKGAIGMPSEVEDDFVFEISPVGVALSGCPLGVTCKFGAKKAKLQYVVSESFTSNELRAEGAVLEKISGGEACGSTSKWFANYVTSVPSQWWLGLI